MNYILSIKMDQLLGEISTFKWRDIDISYYINSPENIRMFRYIVINKNFDDNIKIAHRYLSSILYYDNIFVLILKSPEYIFTVKLFFDSIIYVGWADNINCCIENIQKKLTTTIDQESMLGRDKPKLDTNAEKYNSCENNELYHQSMSDSESFSDEEEFEVDDSIPKQSKMIDNIFQLDYNGSRINYYYNDPSKYTNFNYLIISAPITLEFIVQSKKIYKDMIYCYFQINDNKIIVPKNTTNLAWFKFIFANTFDDIILGYAETLDNCLEILLIDSDQNPNNIIRTQEKELKLQEEMNEIKKFYESCENNKNIEEDLYNEYDQNSIGDELSYGDMSDEIIHYEYDDPQLINDFYYVAIHTDKSIIFFADIFTDKIVRSITNIDDIIIIIADTMKMLELIINILKKIFNPNDNFAVSGYSGTYTSCIEEITQKQLENIFVYYDMTLSEKNND